MRKPLLVPPPEAPPESLPSVPLPVRAANRRNPLVGRWRQRADTLPGGLHDASQRPAVTLHMDPRGRLQHQQRVGGKLVHTTHEHTTRRIRADIARSEECLHHTLLQVLLITRRLLDEY